MRPSATWNSSFSDVVSFDTQWSMRESLTPLMSSELIAASGVEPIAVPANGCASIVEAVPRLADGAVIGNELKPPWSDATPIAATPAAASSAHAPARRATGRQLRRAQRENRSACSMNPPPLRMYAGYYPRTLICSLIFSFGSPVFPLNVPSSAGRIADVATRHGSRTLSRHPEQQDASGTHERNLRNVGRGGPDQGPGAPRALRHRRRSAPLR